MALNPATTDAFRNITVVENTYPEATTTTVAAEIVGDTLTITGGFGITITADPVTDSIVINNTGDAVGAYTEITDANADATYYPIFSRPLEVTPYDTNPVTGEHQLDTVYIDKTTTPLTYNPNSGLMTVNNLSVTSHVTLEGVTSTGATGTGKLVFDTAPTIAGGSVTGLTTFGIRDTTAAFDVRIVASSTSAALTDNRTLTIDVGDAARTVQLNGNLSFGGTFTTNNNFTIAGPYEATITPAGVFNATFPAGTYTLPTNDQTFYIGTTQVAINRASAALTLNGVTSEKATNIVGGNNTTLLGAIPYQSNTDATSLLSPNTTTTRNFLRMTGDGTNGTAPVWDTVTATDVGLENVTNESKTTMFTDPTFTGTVVAETVAMGISSASNLNGDGSRWNFGPWNTRIHLHNSTTGAVGAGIKFTRFETGSTTTDGIDIGINNYDNFVINQNENKGIALATNGVERLFIDGSGNIDFVGTVTISTPLAITEGGTGANNTSDALNNLLPSGEVSGYVLKTSGAGSYYWAAETGASTVVGTKIDTSRITYTATANQTEFTGVGTYTIGAGQLRVYIDGVRQNPDAYTETSTTSFTLSAGVPIGTKVLAEVDGYKDFTVVANAVTFSSTGSISATNVQDALAELDTEKAPLASPSFTGHVTIEGVTSTGATGTGNLVFSASPTFTGTVNGITATMVGLGNVTNESKATMFANPTFTGNTTLYHSTEVLSTKTGATGIVTHDSADGSIWYHSGVVSNFIANFLVSTTDNRVNVLTLILQQGSTAYTISSIQVNGTATGINWLNGSVPVGNVNKKDIYSFTLIRTGAAWTVLGAQSTFG